MLFRSHAPATDVVYALVGEPPPSTTKKKSSRHGQRARVHCGARVGGGGRVPAVVGVVRVVFASRIATWRAFDEEVHLLPGDVVRVECEFDTRKRTECTYSGGEIQDEMCFHFMAVYPASSVIRQLGHAEAYEPQDNP